MSRSPLNPLQTFVAAARAQNLTRAAERLHLTVSALSHQIRLLEERVDCALFVRGPRPETHRRGATPAGQRGAPPGGDRGRIEADVHALRQRAGAVRNAIDD